jgi:hypothetical protein
MSKRRRSKLPKKRREKKDYSHDQKRLENTRRG